MGTDDFGHDLGFAVRHRLARLGYRLGYPRVPISPPTYLCRSCDQKVLVGEDHEHWCPLEGDKCRWQACNEKGMCLG